MRVLVPWSPRVWGLGAVRMVAAIFVEHTIPVKGIIEPASSHGPFPADKRTNVFNNSGVIGVPNYNTEIIEGALAHPGPVGFQVRHRLADPKTPEADHRAQSLTCLDSISLQRFDPRSGTPRSKLKLSDFENHALARDGSSRWIEVEPTDEQTKGLPSEHPQPAWKRTESIRMRRGSLLFGSEKCDEVGRDFTYPQSSVI
jgi:hypothetical protein